MLAKSSCVLDLEGDLSGIFTALTVKIQRWRPNPRDRGLAPCLGTSLKKRFALYYQWVLPDQLLIQLKEPERGSKAQAPRVFLHRKKKSDRGFFFSFFYWQEMIRFDIKQEIALPRLILHNSLMWCIFVFLDCQINVRFGFHLQWICIYRETCLDSNGSFMRKWLLEKLVEMNKYFGGLSIWSWLRHSVVGDPKAVWLHCSGEAIILWFYMTIKGLFLVKLRY